MRQLLVENVNGKTEIALLEDRALMDFWRFEQGTIEPEQIYLGVVDRIAKGMNAAFVKLSAKENGFLPFSEAKTPLKGGDQVLVQIKKPPVQGKAAYLTQDIALAKEHVILLPLSTFCAVSKRVEDPAARAALLEKAKRLAPSGMGLVMRHESSAYSDEQLSQDVQALTCLWESIQEKAAKAAAPCLIEQPMNGLERVLRDNLPLDKVTVDSKTDGTAFASLELPVSVSDAPFALFNVRENLKKALGRRVWLKSGGFLVVDPCEAMTVIDVNTGKFTGGKSGVEGTFLSLNREAAREIARLMRLRSLGGIILVDFIDMQQEQSRQLILDEMRQAVLSDPVKCVVHGFTSLGLMEITRKKTSEALKPGSEQPLCPYCHGTGLRQEDKT